MTKSASQHYKIHRRSDFYKFPEATEVEKLSKELNKYLNREKTKNEIAKTHLLGASSHQIQNIVKDFVLELGFTSEKKGLFAEYDVAGLRPDYYKPLSNTGILFEVERGKTNANNMDLLDLWKTHICKHAHHLFLMVPVVRQTEKNPNGLKIFTGVDKRVASFFQDHENEINVRSVSIFGY